MGLWNVFFFWWLNKRHENADTAGCDLLTWAGRDGLPSPKYRVPVLVHPQRFERRRKSFYPLRVQQLSADTMDGARTGYTRVGSR